MYQNAINYIDAPSIIRFINISYIVILLISSNKTDWIYENKQRIIIMKSSIIKNIVVTCLLCAAIPISWSSTQSMVICIVICAPDKTSILTSATYMYTKVVRICRKIIKKDESMKVWHLDHDHKRIRDWFELFYFCFYQILTAINKFKIMLDVVHDDWKRLNIDSPSVGRGLQYFSTQES